MRNCLPLGVRVCEFLMKKELLSASQTPGGGKREEISSCQICSVSTNCWATQGNPSPQTKHPLMRARNFSTLLNFIPGLILASLSAGSAGTSAYQDIVLGDSPLIYFQFDETSGTTAGNSGSTGAMNDGAIGTDGGEVTINEPSFLNGGTSYDFGGGNVVAAALPSSLTEWSIEAWVNWDPAKTSASNIFGNDQGGWNDDVLFGIGAEGGTMGVPENSIGLIQQGSSGTTRDFVESPMSDSEWHHVVVTASTTNSELILYVDGVEVAKEVNVNNGLTMNGGKDGDPDTIGSPFIAVGAARAVVDPGYRYFDGLIDEFAIYDTVLDAGAILIHYTAGVSDPPSSSVPIPGLFSTGIGEDGELLGGSGAIDPHYELIESPDNDANGPDAVTLNPGFPVGPWIEEGPGSRWIAPEAAQNIGSAPGQYTYRTKFNLSGFDLATVRIVGRWASDNGGTDILINEEGSFNSAPSFTDWSDFEITEGFVSGENTLDFVLSNAGDAANPTGVRVEILETSGDRTAGVPPSIIVQPRPRRGVVGDTVNFAVTVGGSPPFEYQWRKGGEDITGATRSQLELSDISDDNAGDYSVVVANAVGMETSEDSNLTVLRPIQGLFGTGVDEAGAPLDDLAVDAHYRIIDNADGDPIDAIVHDSSVFPIVGGPWLANSETSKWIGPRGDTEESAGGDYTYRISFDLKGLDASTAFIEGSWSTDNAGLDILLNGASLGLTNPAQFGNLTAFAIADAPFISGMNTLDFVLNNAGAGTTALRVDGLRGGAARSEGGAIAPTFLLQPEDAVALIGESVTLTSLADGTPPLTYEWKRDDESVGDLAQLALEAIQPAQAGDYVVTVSNAQGSVSSEPISVSVIEPIPGLFNTAIGGDGAALDAAEPDPHYRLIADPNDEGLEAIVIGSLPGAWVANHDAAKWIGVQEDNGGPGGDYTYRLTFDLSAFDADNVFIEGDWATDNLGTDLILNDVSTGLKNDAQFTAVTKFRIVDGFIPGINTLDFVINNAGDAANPTGLFVDNLRGGGATEDPNLIGPAMTPFGQLDESKPVKVTALLRNSGRTQTLTITDSNVIGTNADLFTLSGVPAELGANETVEIQIMVDPKGATGNFDAALQLTTNDPSTPVAEFDLSAFIPVAPNLIAHYKLDQANGDRLVDSSGFGVNGVFNAIAGAIQLGQAGLAAGSSVSFIDGSFAEVAPDVLPPFADFSVSLWHVPGATDTAATILSRGDGQGDPFALVSQGTTLFWFSAGEPAVQLDDALTLDQNHHIVVTVAGTTVTIYIDGVEAGSGNAVPFADKESNPLQFGGTNGILGINGQLDDIQIYNRSLTSEETTFLFNNPGEVVGGGGVEPPIPVPVLTIAREGADVRLKWPSAALDFRLHSSSSLTDWTAVESAPEEDDDTLQVVLPIEGSLNFRLQK